MRHPVAGSAASNPRGFGKPDVGELLALAGNGSGISLGHRAGGCGANSTDEQDGKPQTRMELGGLTP